MSPPATPEAEMPRVQGDEIGRQWKVLETGFTDREWLPETPFYFRGGVATAFDEETFEPLFLVWCEPEMGGGWVTTHWMPLPEPPEPTP